VCDLAISLSDSSIFLLLYVNQWLLTSPPLSSCPFYLYFSKCFRRQFLCKRRSIYLPSLRVILCRVFLSGCRDSSVGIATRYETEGPGMKSRWGRDIPHSSGTSLGPASLLYNGYRVFPGCKRPGRGVDHPPPSSAEVEGRVELYIYSPSSPSWYVLGWNLSFYTFTKGVPFIRHSL
jgi:hypothetical protein